MVVLHKIISNFGVFEVLSVRGLVFKFGRPTDKHKSKTDLADVPRVSNITLSGLRRYREFAVAAEFNETPKVYGAKHSPPFRNLWWPSGTKSQVLRKFVILQFNVHFKFIFDGRSAQDYLSFWSV